MKGLNLNACWDLVNGITRLDQCVTVEEILKTADITNDDYDDLMEAVACQYRLIYHNK